MPAEDETQTTAGASELLAFYQEIRDDSGDAVSWGPVVWTRGSTPGSTCWLSSDHLAAGGADGGVAR